MTGADEDFAEFARASYGGLRHAAYLLTGDRHSAEDAAQTALVRTYAAWSRVRRDDAYAYARKVLVNHVTDRWRRRLREYPPPLADRGARHADREGTRRDRHALPLRPARGRGGQGSRRHHRYRQVH